MAIKKHKPSVALTLAALGVVFGDIGTSPLYAFETAVGGTSVPLREAVLGVCSLIIWSLLLLVTFKYVLLVMRADYHGEGGVFALLALLQSGKGRPICGPLPASTLMLLFGAALLFGDGTITPAISVLSALEGIEAFDPSFERFVIPATVGILAALFAIQRLGTGRLGLAFGGVMVLWFLVIGGLGAYWISREPGVLEAFNPVWALNLLLHEGPRSLVLMGSVVLAVTGVEALYADMGHFGRQAISLAWHCIALPALLLNYLGQAALVLGNPAALHNENLFFLLVPKGAPTLILAGLATAATVIASQALISGIFSLTAQAQELNYFPRSQVMHTSRKERGQVYVPLANWVLGGVCILLVLTFRTSNNLAAAYGSAVVGTMVTTTIALLLIMLRVWKWPVWRAGLITALILAVEIPFFVSCLTKIPEGGYFPFLVALALLIVMLTWHRGRSLVLSHMRQGSHDVAELIALQAKGHARAGQLVMITTNRHPRYAAARAFELYRRGGILRKQVVLLSLISSMESDVDIPRSVEVKPLAPNLWHVTAIHGFMQEPHGPEIIATAAGLSEGALAAPSDDTFYVVGRELILEDVNSDLRRWRRRLFGFMSRNVTYAPDYFFIPESNLIEFTWMMRI